MGMADTNSRGIAIGLMRQAMVFLEKAEDWDTAARLQHALDVALAARPLQPGEELDPQSAALIAGIPLSSD